MGHQPVPVSFPWSLGKSNPVPPLPSNRSVPRPRPRPVSTDPLTELRSQFGSPHFAFDAFLSTVAARAQAVSEASGAIVALQQQQAIVCRAKCGQTGPPLGAELNVGSGISGACLSSGRTLYCADTETDPRVDSEACRRLGLRSIAVIPIFERASMAGILEVFATKPHAFNEKQIDLLEQLSELVTAARMRVSQGLPAERSELPAPPRIDTTSTIAHASTNSDISSANPHPRTNSDISSTIPHPRTRPYVAPGACATRRHHWLTALTSWSCCARATGTPLLGLLTLSRCRPSDGWGR